jgi:hypothetical protein
VADTPQATHGFITFGQKIRNYETSLHSLPPQARRHVLRRRHGNSQAGGAEATALLNARNESVRQPQLNLQIAKAYLAGTDSGVSKRTWEDAFNAITENKHGTTKERWQRAVKQKAFDLILPLIIIETQAEQMFACLKAGRSARMFICVSCTTSASQ